MHGDDYKSPVNEFELGEQNKKEKVDVQHRGAVV